MAALRFFFPIRRYGLLFVAAAAASCAPLPDKPDTRAVLKPPEWSQTWDAAAKGDAFQQSASLSRTWWKAFNDKALNDLIDTALQGNPTLAIAQARVNEARLAAHLVKLNTGARFESDGSVVREHFSTNGLYPPPLGGMTTNEGDMSVSVAYTLDWWGKNRALLETALSENKSAQAEHNAAELVLTQAVADTYFSWQDVTARIRFAKESVEKRRAVLELSKMRLSRGLDSAFNATRAEESLAEEEKNLRELEGQSQIMRNRLAALAGNGPDWGAKLEEPAEPARDAIALPGKLPLDWLANRPDISALKWHAEAAARRIDEARAEFYPNVDLNLLLGLQSLDVGKWLSAQSGYAAFGPAVHIPLFNVRTLRTNLSMNETAYQAAAAQYNQALVTAASQVADALAQVNSVNAQARLQDAATDDAERAYQIQNARFEKGLNDRRSALEEEIALLSQRARKSSLNIGRKHAMVTLFAAIGGGFEGTEEKNNVGSAQ